MKKFRIQRFAAITAATALLLCQPGITGLAGEAETASDSEPVTEAYTEPVTQAATEIQTEPPTAPQTEAPVQTEASAPVIVPEEDILDGGDSGDSAPAAPAQEPEKAAEKKTEKQDDLFEEDDDEDTVTDLTAQAGGLEVRLTLPEGKGVSADTELKVTELGASDGGVYSNALSMVREKTDEGHRALTELYLYRIELTKEDKTVPLEGEAKLSFAWSSLISPGLTPWMQSEAYAFRIGDSAQELCEISLSADEEDHRGFTGFEISGQDLSLIGVAGVENRGPQSGKKTKKDLQKDLKDLSDYAVAANRLELEEGVFLDDRSLAGEIVTAGGADDTEKTAEAKKVEAVLEVASLTGLKIADSASSEEVSFVTVYADENGNIDEEPLGAWIREDEDGKEFLDVTDAFLVINIAANDAQQDLELPEWDVYVRETEQEEEEEDIFAALDDRKAKEDAGRVLYNLVAEDGNKLTKYEGELTVKENEKGTILAPQAKVILEKENIGAVYADRVTLKKEAILERAAFAAEEEEPEVPAQAEEQEIPVPAQEEELVSEEPTEEAGEEPTEEASEEPTEGKMTLSAALDAPRLDAEEQVVRITVNAILDGETPSAFPADFLFGVYDGEKNLVKDTDGNELTRTIQAGTGKISFVIDTSYEEVFKGGDFYVQPIGEMTDYDLVSTEPEEGKVTISISDTGDAGAEPDTVTFRYKEKEEPQESDPVFTVSELDETTKAGLAGGKIAVSMADGTVLVLQTAKETGNIVTVNSKDGETVKIPLDKNKAFADALNELGKVDLKVSAITAPTDPAGYAFSGTTETSLTITADDSGETPAATLLFKKRGAVSNDKVKVTKYVYVGDNTGIYHTGAHNYYVALFADEKLTRRVTDVQTIRFTGAGLTASATFNYLPAGTYFVGETDAYGNLVGREKDSKKAADPYYVDYSDQKVTVSSITTKTITVQMKNHYFEFPKDANYYRTIKITKNVTDEKGKAKNSNGTFYFMVNNDSKNIQQITLNKKSSGYKYVYLKASDKNSYTITEVQPQRNSDGTYKKENGNYVYENINKSSTWEASYKGNPATFTDGTTSVREVTVTNKEINSKSGGTDSDKGTDVSTEATTNKPSDTATITMVKKTTYKGNPIRLNSTFYISIFEDAALTKLRSKPVKMTLSNASEKQRSMTVNLYLLDKDKRTVTLYFAETDSDGKVLTSSRSGYDISPEGAVKVTVDPQNPEATVTFTNNITVGSAMEQRLLDPSSGLAGDANAVDDSAKGIGGDGSTQTGTSAKTGDETPVGLWIMTLLCACVVAWLMIGQAKKRNKEA